jgi:hypothetical protein
MSANNHQREKATETMHIRLTPSVAEKVQDAANETFGGNASGWARRELELAAHRVVAEYNKRQPCITK